MGKKIKEASLLIIEKGYDDIVKPVAKPMGEVLSLIPRAIHAALIPLEKFILKSEYNLKETIKILEQKLKNINPSQICTPEPNIAVPIFQYISYCMDNEELREVYANLLASSMNKMIKNNVHPGFVEIIKQLSPDEAKLLKYLAKEEIIPVIGLRYENEAGSGLDVINDYTNILEKIGCEQPSSSNLYIDNLVRLGLLVRAGSFYSLTDKSLYESVKKSPMFQEVNSEEKAKQNGFVKARVKESFVSLTSYGRSFCSVCISN